MDVFFTQLFEFFATNVPSLGSLAVGGPLGLLWSAACLFFSGQLKARWHWPTGYTRKVFHFLIFGTVVVVHWLWGTPGVCLFGAMTTITLAYALLRGSGHVMYEAIAREKDAPHRTRYIVVPYFATLTGGLIVNACLPRTALFGYLVTGLGDAVAEPVGTRYGKHAYRVPARRGVRAMRTWEGSGAVLVVSLLALLACLIASPAFPVNCRSLVAITLIAAASTLVEAVAPHGWDNAALQIVPAWLGALLF